MLGITLGLIQDLLSQKENYFCTQIRAAKARELKRIADEHEFRGRLSVGDFAQAGLNGCPKKMVQDKAKGKRFAVKTGYKLDLGKEIHRSYQQAALDTPNLLWVKPYNFPGDIMVTSPDKPEGVSFKTKLDEGFPELPVCLLDSDGDIAILGYADGVMNKYQKPNVVEIKSVNVEPLIFKNKFSDNYPDPKHLLQVKIYIYLMWLWGYYEAEGVPELSQGTIPYICVRGEMGDDACENEVGVTLSEEEKSIIAKYLQEGVRQVEATKNGLDLDCNYLHCKRCNKEDN